MYNLLQYFVVTGTENSFAIKLGFCKIFALVLAHIVRQRTHLSIWHSIGYTAVLC